jgi:hypothetical protein
MRIAQAEEYNLSGSQLRTTHCPKLLMLKT